MRLRAAPFTGLSAVTGWALLCIQRSAARAAPAAASMPAAGYPWRPNPRPVQRLPPPHPWQWCPFGRNRRRHPFSQCRRLAVPAPASSARRSRPHTAHTKSAQLWRRSRHGAATLVSGLRLRTCGLVVRRQKSSPAADGSCCGLALTAGGQPDGLLTCGPRPPWPGAQPCLRVVASPMPPWPAVLPRLAPRMAGLLPGGGGCPSQKEAQRQHLVQKPGDGTDMNRPHDGPFRGERIRLYRFAHKPFHFL